MWGLALGTAGLLAAACGAGWLVRNPRADVHYGLVWLVGCLYARLVQRARFGGRDVLKGLRPGEGLVVVANHTSGMDPILIQVGLREREVRWVMTREMRVRALDPVWAYLDIIFVGTDGARSGTSELAAVKEMIRHVKRGGVLGIFPEGRIVRPRGTLHPFQPGVGSILARTGARVLPVFVRGTPETETAFSSLFRFGRAHIEYLPLIETRGKTGEQIVAELQQVFESELRAGEPRDAGDGERAAATPSGFGTPPRRSAAHPG
ncbi:MAG: lysophospholipid acyltransferase family protein [Phycisphaerales bacterium]